MNLLAIWGGIKKAGPLIGIISALAAAVTAFIMYSNWLIDIGDKQAVARMQGEQVEAMNAYKEELQKEMADALEVQAADHQDALARAQGRTETVTVTEEVVKYVDKIIIDDSCHKLAFDFISVRRESTDAIRAAAGAYRAD